MRPSAFSRLAAAVITGLAPVAFAAEAAAQASFFEQIFGLGSPPPAQSRPLPRSIESVRPRPVQSDDQDGPARGVGTGSTFRTVCVRTCDGFYFPVSFATTRNNFAADQQKCQASCKDAQLFVYKNPGEGIDDATDLSGRPYPRLPNAFRFRKVHVEQCGCRPAPWTQAEMQRHRAYAIAEGKPVPPTAEANPGTVARADAAPPAPNALEVAAAEPTDAISDDTAKTDDSAVAAAPKAEKAPEKKSRVAQRPPAAKVVRAGVASTAVSAPVASKPGGGGFGIFSMGLGAPPQYTWPGDAPKRR